MILFHSYILYLIVSLVPFLNARLVGVFLVSIFMWHMLPLFFAVVLFLSVSLLALRYIGYKMHLYWSAFMLFILTEVFAFGGLMTSCLIYEPDCAINMSLSNYFELPLFGSIVLLGSSVTVTAFHHKLGLPSSRKWLVLTIILGFCFLVVQFLEFSFAEKIWSDGFYYSSCFSLVGLHFRHVLLGLFALSYMFYYTGSLYTHPNDFYCSAVVWYWHFVDLIWLFVFFIVYYC